MSNEIIEKEILAIINKFDLGDFHIIIKNAYDNYNYITVGVFHQNIRKIQPIALCDPNLNDNIINPMSDENLDWFYNKIKELSVNNDWSQWAIDLANYNDNRVIINRNNKLNLHIPKEHEYIIFINNVFDNDNCIGQIYFNKNENIMNTTLYILSNTDVKNVYPFSYSNKCWIENKIVMLVNSPNNYPQWVIDSANDKCILANIL